MSEYKYIPTVLEAQNAQPFSLKCTNVLLILNNFGEYI